MTGFCKITYQQMTGADKVLFFTGDTRSKKLIKILREHRIGRTVIDNRIRPYPGEKWIFDNGAYRDWKAGKAFDHDAYMRRMEMAQGIGNPYFAVLPDVVCDAKATLELSFDYLDKLPREWHVYLVLQNGMTYGDVTAFQCASSLRLSGLFLGGDDAYKMTAANWSCFAHRELLIDFHYGRCGTWWKIEHARQVNADSCDSALPLWLNSRMEDCLKYLDNELPQGQWWGFYEVEPERFCVEGGENNAILTKESEESNVHSRCNRVSS
jgi:hypothetical protein